MSKLYPHLNWLSNKAQSNSSFSHNKYTSQNFKILKLHSVYFLVYIFFFVEPGRKDHACVQIDLAIVPGGWKWYAHNYTIVPKIVGRQQMSGLSMSLFYA